MSVPLSFPPALTRIVPWAQALLIPVLTRGALAVDLTAGSGRDTLFLFEQVGPAGCILSFDVQPAALQQTAELLTAAGAAVHRHPPAAVLSPRSSGVHLFPLGHEKLATVLDAAPAAIVANLGYLPGGDPTVTTRSASTLAALEQSCTLLAKGGRLAAVAYPGHPGGAAEALAVESFFAALDPAGWEVLRIAVPNRTAVPFLLLAEKRK